MRKCTSLLFALLVILSLAVPALAAESVVDYHGHKLFDFEPGSAYTDTDLFEDFKAVMPGDTRQETVTVKNTARCCDYIKVYLQAVPHDDKNPLSPSVATDETIASMETFLAQLKLTVKKGDTVIFEGPANEMDEMKRVYLGKLSRNKSTELDLTLEVPIELGNDFAFREGEIDWKFTIEEYDYKSETPKTGDHMAQTMIPYALALVLSAAVLMVLLMGKRKKR